MAQSDHGDQKAPLDALEAKLAEKRVVEEPKRHQDEHYSQLQHAWRMVIELVAGLVICFGMGYGLDALFGTAPFLMIVFTGLGFVAGIRTMMRSAGEMEKEAAARAAADEEGER